MRPKRLPSKTTPGERVVKDIRRTTRRHFSAEEEIRIVLDGLRGEGVVRLSSNTVARGLSGARPVQQGH